MPVNQGFFEIINHFNITTTQKNVISRLAGKGLLLEKKVDNVTMFSSNVNLVKLKDNNI